MTAPAQSLSTVIRQIRTQYVQQLKAFSYYSINNGLCEEFALEVLAEVGDAAYTDVCNEVYQCGLDGSPQKNEKWDWKLLEALGIRPPSEFPLEVLDQLPFGSHVWITDGQKHYDAECPEGVSSFFELPLFKRYLVFWQRNRGINAPDVITEDVVPPPLCSIRITD